MDPLERAHTVLARAAAASAAASLVLPARAKLAEQVHAHTAALAAQRAALRAQQAALTAAQRAEVEQETCSALARARLVQLMRLSADLLSAVAPAELGVPGLAREGAPPVDDAALPYSLREPLKLQARVLAGAGAATPFQAPRARSRAGGSAPADAAAGGGAVGALALTRPDLLAAAAAGQGEGGEGGWDAELLGEGHAVLLAGAGAWVRAELARRERLRQGAAAAPFPPAL